MHYYLEIHHRLENKASVASEGEACVTLFDVEIRKTRPGSSGQMEGGQSVVKVLIHAVFFGLYTFFVWSCCDTVTQ